jgi:hypothetical protein
MDMDQSEEFNEPSVISADRTRPGQLYAYIDEKLAQRVIKALAQMDKTHGHKRFLGHRGEPLPWGVSINTSLRDALASAFEVVDDPSNYDNWIAALEEAAAFLRSEKAEYEKELATTVCSHCGHPLAAHMHEEPADLSCGSRECLCPQFQPEATEEIQPPRVLRLIKGGKPPKRFSS